MWSGGRWGGTRHNRAEEEDVQGHRAWTPKQACNTRNKANRSGTPPAPKTPCVPSPKSVRSAISVCSAASSRPTAGAQQPRRRLAQPECGGERELLVRRPARLRQWPTHQRQRGLG
ncbi:hypothetical protein BS78_03G200800 [Paspalum vaginatum]|nr:hypothetical protein BS78_03G200800 [Paspalum vaginatum]